MTEADRNAKRRAAAILGALRYMQEEKAAAGILLPRPPEVSCWTMAGRTSAMQARVMMAQCRFVPPKEPRRG